MILQEALKLLRDNKEKSIILWDKAIGDSGAKDLSEALKVNTSVTRIYFRGNNIGDSGAKDLAQALKINTSVTSIYLGFNNIGASGAKDLSEALKVNTSVISIDLSRNNIGDSGVKDLAQALKVNTSMTRTDLYGNRISDSLLKKMESRVETNKQKAERLIAAAEMGNLSQVQQWVQAKASLNHQDVQGNTAIHYAALNDHQAVVAYLLSQSQQCLVPNIHDELPSMKQATASAAYFKPVALPSVKPHVGAKEIPYRQQARQEHAQKQQLLFEALLKAMSCEGEDNLPLALHWYDQALQLDKHHVLAWKGKADILYDQAQLQQAQAIYRHILTLDAKDLHATYQLKTIAAKLQKQAAEAKRLCRQQAEHLQAQQRQEQVAQLVTQAKGYFEQADFSAALATLNQIIQLQPQHLPYYLARSRIYVKLQDYAAALSDSEVILKHKGGQISARYQRGLCYQGLGKLKLAIADFKYVLQQQPEYAEAHYQLGCLLLNDKQYPQAIAALDAAICYRPEDIDGYHARSQALFQAEQYEKSLQDIEYALQANPLDIRFHLLKGFNLSAKGDHGAAITSFNQVLRKDRFHINGRFNRAYSQQQLGDFDKALSDYSLLVNQLKRDCLLVNQQKFEKSFLNALSDYSLSVNQRKKEQDTTALLGVILFSRGSNYQAMGCPTQAHQDMQNAKLYLKQLPHPSLEHLWLAPDLQLAIADQEILVQVAHEQIKHEQRMQVLKLVSAAEVYINHGTLELALRQCEQALAIDNTCAEAYWLRGSLYQRQNRWDEAFSCFLTVENLNPDFQGIQSALANAKKQSYSEQEKMAYQHWLKEEAPNVLFNAVLRGLRQGVSIESDSKFPPLYGLCKNGGQLSLASIELLQKAFTNVLFTSQLLTKDFERAHQAIIVYKVVERLLALFSSETQAKQLFSQNKVVWDEIGLKPKTTLQKIEEQMSTALLRARECIKQQEQYHRDQQVLHESSVTFFSQPKVSIPSDLRIKTIFARPVTPQLAVVALLRAKANEHALLVMMQLSDNDILQMFGYHFRPHPDNMRLGIVHIAQEKITLSPADTEEQLLLKQDGMLLNKKFAEFPIKDCEYQPFSLSLGQAQDLHEAVKRDFARNGHNPILYFKGGNKSIFAPSVSHYGHSCFTWAREKLKDIGLATAEDWTDYFVARTSYHINPNNEKRCLIM